MKKQLRHSEVDTMTPVDNWQDKVNKLNDLFSENYNYLISEGVDDELLHELYLRIYNRYKFTNWEIEEGGFVNYTFGACHKMKLTNLRKANRFLSLTFDVSNRVESSSDTPKLNESKLNTAIQSLSKPQKEAYKEMFIHRRTASESAKKLGLTYVQVANRQFRAFRRIAQLYNQV